MAQSLADAGTNALPAGSDRRQVNRLGLFVGLGGITMLFAAFTSAYIVRSGGGDWVALELPPVVWLGTGLLIGSSLTLELARRAWERGILASFRSWSALTLALGAGFLGAQFASWNALTEAGIHLQSHPKSSFFFVLTGVHGAHLIAGVVALLALFGMAVAGRLVPGRSDAPTLTAIYWHFMGGLWLYLLAILSFLG